MSDEYGWRIDKDGEVIVNTRIVAERFGRRHNDLCDVVQSIREKLHVLNIEAWFRLNNYIDSQGRHQRSFDMMFDGWTLLVMGFTGDDMLPIKVAFILAYREMEDALRAGRSASPDLMAKLDELKSLYRHGHSRAYLPAKVQQEHIAEVQRQGCVCPCCRDVVIVAGYQIIKDATGKAIAEFDHFYHVGKAILSTTWLICVRCHQRLTNGKILRHEAEPHFRAYQTLLAGRQPGLFA